MLALVAAPAFGAAIDQTPIVRVLRTNDVPGSTNTELPSGALKLKQLVVADVGAAGAPTAEEAALSPGFQAAAISQFRGPGTRLLTSFAVEYASPGQAAKALGHEVGALARSGVPKGSVATRESVGSLPAGTAVLYRGSAQSSPAGVVVLAREGSWVFSLRGSGDTGGSSRSFLAKLLGVVIARQ